ncbi:MULTISPECIES: AAA family ATPase [Mycobacterium avium complex (MAC)]|uniref:AAA family ATPase n=1 Tax=Mycobacterium avium complex (MAC) TaxID=120793 RepID=UPI0009FF0A32|nr:MULTISPECIES: ATP-binding protein [Mycobacterium avium complex (MAC)]UCN12679.1 ATP-binding protein [Mycobacterium intracellulare subsp. chimaera]
MNTPVPTALHTSPPGLDEWLAGLDPLARPALRALGTLLSGAAAAPKSETEDQFTARCLGVADCGQLVEEERDLSPVGRMTFPLALAEWIGGHPQCVVGPGEHTNSPMWTQTEIGDHQYRHPMCLRAYFPAGTLLEETGCVLHVESRAGVLRSAVVSAFVAPEHQDLARRVLDRLSARAGELNPFRGRVVRAVYDGGLRLVAMDLPSSVTRDSVVVSEGVWAEVDLGVVSVRDRFALLNAHGLGSRRGVLLCGPPGTGKSAVCAAVAREVAGVFTVIYVDPKAGSRLLTEVVEEAQRLGGPVLLVLEDIDLWCQDRRTGGSALSELLQAMDIEPDSRILTLASTNDVSTLDTAAIRTGRFDAVVEVGYPGLGDAARILAMFVRGLPGADGVDVDAVAAALPDQTSGSDLREIVRRAVLAGPEAGISTRGLLDEVSSRRYQGQAPAGLYL